jgi:hypothetical protein
MGPGQLATQRVTNWKGLKMPLLFEIGQSLATVLGNL